MKNEEFVKCLDKLGFDGWINICVYYGDDDGDVILDEDMIREELDEKIEKINEVLK